MSDLIKKKLSISRLFQCESSSSGLNTVLQLVDIIQIGYINDEDDEARPFLGFIDPLKSQRLLIRNLKP